MDFGRTGFVKAVTIALVLFAGMFSAFADDVQARWQLESTEAVIGQSLTLRIFVEGTDSIIPPKFSIPGVDIEWKGGSPSNSTSVVMVNGKTTRTVSKSFVGDWSLKANKSGYYHLDAIDWNVNGKTIRLDDLDWNVGAAQSDSRFILRQKLQPENSIPGVDIEYSLIWYIGESAQNPEFNIPILDNPDIEMVPNSQKSPSSDSFQMQYRGNTLIGIKGTDSLNGAHYTTITFDFKVRPKKAGTYDLSDTRVTFEGAIANQQTQDFFGNLVNEPQYKTLTAQADSRKLIIRDLPEKGKPNPFSGLIGKLSLSWEGAQGGYRVGEPIRVKLRLDGVLNKPNLDLDYMVISALNGSDFQVSADDALLDSGKTAGAANSSSANSSSRSFVLRAKKAGKLVVPSLSLNYYDPDSKQYGVTKTSPLEITVTGNAATGTAAGGSAGSPDASAGSAGTAEASGSLGSANATKAVGASGTSTSATPGASDVSSGNSLGVNPPNLFGEKVRDLPWWFFALPGAAGGCVLALVGLWRHSRRRKLVLERKSWQTLLVALESNEGRAALEEGRARLRLLSCASGSWADRLALTGKMLWLSAKLEEWDLAFFADNRGDEPWAARWEEIIGEARTWK